MTIDVRAAQNSDGPRIGELAKQSGFPVDGLDWSEVSPWWMVAEDDGKVIGAIQVMLAKPIGWLEMLVMDEGLSELERARVVKALVLEKGQGVLAGFGAQLLIGVIPFQHKAYKRALEKRGGVIFDSGNLMVKRLRN